MVFKCLFIKVLLLIVVADAVKRAKQGQRAVRPRVDGPPLCPHGCECDTPGVVSCIATKFVRLPLRLPPRTKFFYAEHNRFMTPVLNHRNFTNYIGNMGQSTIVGMSLHNCSLTMIGFRTFTSLTSLQELDLSNNKISVIEDNTFNGLNLNMLDLSYNVGIQFSKLAFAGCTVRRIALRAVGLKTFDLATFSSLLPNLMSLSLADNRLLTLDYRLFSCAPNLSTVYFARNPWWCGGDCSTTQLITYISRTSSDLVMDEAPKCQPGYEEQQDAELNKVKCKAGNELIKAKNFTLPPCPASTTVSGRSLPNEKLEGRNDIEELTSPESGFVAWGDGVVANYSRDVDLTPAASTDDSSVDTVAISPDSGCYRLSTIVSASIMSSVATLVTILSLCLCIRACYLRCHPNEAANVQTQLYPIKNMKNGSSRNGQQISILQGQPLLPNSGSDSTASVIGVAPSRQANRAFMSS